MAKRSFTGTVYNRIWVTNGKKKKAYGVRYLEAGKYVSRILGTKD